MEDTTLENRQSIENRHWRRVLQRLGAGIGTKIILPYFLLTLTVAGVGAFVVTNLVTSSLQERFHNQLLDAGRVVAESMVRDEALRLEVLRAVAGTEGVPESLAAGDRAALARLVPQIIANSHTDAVELLDRRGLEVYGWQRPPDEAGMKGEERAGADYTQLEEVRRVLDGFVDEHGEKRVLLSRTPHGLMIFTIGPVYRAGERIGAVLVGTYVHKLVVGLTESAVARVTLYDRYGQVIDTTLGGGQAGIAETLHEPAQHYDEVLALLQTSPDEYQLVVTRAESEVSLRQVEILGQRYLLAYGDWRLRGQSFGLFSVALPSNFIVGTAATSRNLLSLFFSLCTMGVFGLGYTIAQRISQPLNRLVQTSMAVARGDLDQRTGIRRNDEIGALASSFDMMTERLAERNRQLLEQASKLEAILNSIADGVIVLDSTGEIITSNPAAERILAAMSDEARSDLLGELPLAVVAPPQPRRYDVGSHVLSALAAPVKAPAGEVLGTVIALRDITREAEAENLKDGFISHISHELRTPLTAVKGYSDLLLKTANGSLGDRQESFVQIIHKNANQLMRHISQLIDISEIQAQTLGLRPERLCLSALVEEVGENWRERMEANELSFRVEALDPELTVQADRVRLQWALDNLLSNACNYTLAGGSVELRVSRAGGEASVEVVDTGIGVAAVDQPFLFSRFFRANNELTFNVRGVGLGLFITRSIVELHGGRVWAESELGAGSTFGLALPLLEEVPAG